MGSDFLRGFTFLWRGWAHLLGRPKLLLIACIPLLLSFFLMSGLLYVVWIYLPGVLQTFLEHFLGIWGFSPDGWLFYLLFAFFGLLFSGVAIYLAYLAQMAFAQPIFSELSSRVLRERGYNLPGGWQHLIRSVATGLLKTLMFLLVGMLCFLISLVPGLTWVWMIAAPTLLACDFMDYSMEGAGFPILVRLRYLFRNFGKIAGMALAVALTMLVPGLTLLLAPGAVIGAALLFDPQFEGVRLGSSAST